MEYLIILKTEVNSEIKRFNDIKRWFLKNYNNKIHYQYEDFIDLSEITSNKFYIVSPYVFPLITSERLEDIYMSEKSFWCDVNNNQISFISTYRKICDKKSDLTSIKYVDLLDVLKKFENLNEDIVKFERKRMGGRKWYYIIEREIILFLRILENFYFTWSNINNLKLKIADRYPEIIYYDGKNKLESKKLVEKLNINVPKTYIIFNNVDEIKQETLDDLPDCIIKPTNLDGSLLIFRKTKDNPVDLDDLKNKMSNFEKINKNKELMPLINKSFTPKIMVEEYIEDLDGMNSKPCEFKFYVFNGKILFFLAINRKADYKKFDFYDENFNKIPNTKLSYKRTQINYDWPNIKYFDRMKKDVFNIYNKFYNDMGRHFIGRFIRIDFFVTRNNYYFGEFSLFPNGGGGNNLNNFGKKYFIECWLHDVFSILRGYQFTVPPLTLEDFDEKLELVNDKSFRFIFKDKISLLNYLFS